MQLKNVFILIFIIVIIYYIYIYNKPNEYLTIISYGTNENKETPMPTLPSILPKVNYFDYFVNKKIYLKCKIDSKYYYLVTLSKKLFPELLSNTSDECSESIVVLIDDDKFNLKKNEYLRKPYQTKEFLGEFIANQYNDKYVFKSIDNENIDNNVKQTMLNQILYTSYNTNKLCGDIAEYFPDSKYHHHPEIELHELQNINDVTTFKMCFITDVVIKTVLDGITNFNKIYDAQDNALRQKSYIGVSDETVKFGQDEFKRVNLYIPSDEKNKKNILTFRVELVN